MSKAIQDLVAAICGPGQHPLALPLSRWCAESRPFTTFAQTYATKIRKKARLASERESVDNLLAELAVAALLVADRRCTVAYEQTPTSGGRSPDFSVLWRTHTLFHVEVTHLWAGGASPDEGYAASPKLARVVCDKLGQLPTGAMNVLLAVVPPDAVDGTLAPAALQLLDGYASRGDDAFFHTRGLDSVRVYTRLRPRLSAIVLRAFADDWTPYAATIWLNPQAKHPLNADIARVLGAMPRL